MKISVIATCRVAGFHNWDKAPTQHAYLKDRHRHEFVVYAVRDVSHRDRETEINQFKQDIETWLVENYGSPCEFGGMSCESIAEMISNQFGLSKCVVLEDGLCGAVYEEVR